MQFGVLITNNGKHSDERLAIATAEQLIQIGADAAGEQAAEGRRLENEFVEILEEHHRRVSEHEVGELTQRGNARLSESMDPSSHVDETYDDLMTAAAASPFAAWYARDEVKKYVRDVLMTWTATNMDIHRDWHAKGWTGHHNKLMRVEGHAPDEHTRAWLQGRKVDGYQVGGLPATLPEALAQ